MTTFIAAESTNPVLPAPVELVVGLLCFFVVFGALGGKFLPVIRRILEERADAIEGGLSRAEEAQAEAQRTLEQYRGQLAEARHEAARLREEAREQGAAIIAEMREEGQRQRDSLIVAGHAQLEADRRQAVSALRRDIGRLGAELAERIIGETLADTAAQQRTVDRFLDELENRAVEEVPVR